MSEVAIRSIFGLFDKWGHENYIGENVTQLQHSQQVKTDNTEIKLYQKKVGFYWTRLLCKQKWPGMITKQFSALFSMT